MPRRALSAGVLLASVASCIPPTLDLTGKACDSQGRCAEGFVCVSGTCITVACSPGAVQACGDTEVCAGPVQTCGSNSQWGPCLSTGDGGAPPCPLQEGVCSGSTEMCGASSEWQTCTSANYGPNYSPVEICDGLDNNCSGDTDEGLAPHLCSNQTGVCKGSTATCGGDAGWLTCTAANYLANNPNYSPSELCDGLDNNCSGDTDEDLAPHLCANQTGVCMGATATCGGDAGWLPCTTANYLANNSNYGPVELCDGLDNNCSGDADEDLPPHPCAADAGVCPGSTAVCGGAAGWLACTPAKSIPPSEVCDGLDTNCSGEIDEGLTQASSAQISSGSGVATSSSVAASVDGGIVVYAESSADGGYAIVAQPVSAALAPSGAPISVGFSDVEPAPEALRLSNGYLVAWLTSGQLRVATIGSDGGLVAAPLSFGSELSQAVSFSAVAANPEGRALAYLVWEDVQSGSGQIDFQPLLSTGSPGAVSLVSSAAGTFHNPATALGTVPGTLGVAFEDASSGPGPIDLVSLDTATGAAVSSAVVVDGDQIGFSPTIAAVSSGFAVAWQQVIGTQQGIGLNVEGGFSGVVAAIPDGGGSNAESPRLATGPSGLGLVWQDDRSQTGTPVIWMARLDGLGNLATESGGPALLHLPSAGGPQLAPDITYTGATYAVSWEVASSTYAVFARELCP